ncbi:MAG TPA: bifunctional UDP-N-acetylglucosamine diphosphorylase/glucosamine-1-phosphate N-acetyltransferase GlmU [Blastocatellia bacterium]
MTDVMILAAGLGTRMKSSRAKVLHQLGGRPLISYPVRTALALRPRHLIVVVGYQAEEVEQAVAGEFDMFGDKSETKLIFVRQTEQRGTGHAVIASKNALAETAGPLALIAGDGPMLKSTTLEHMVATHVRDGNAATFLTAVLDAPTGYGRIARDSNGRFLRTIEEKDATEEERRAREVNVSVYCFDTHALLGAIDLLKADNAQGEYYITDVPRILVEAGKRVEALTHPDAEEVMGINSRVDLAGLERKLRERKLTELMLSGVTIIDPATAYIDQDAVIGPDTVINPQVIIEGKSRIGTRCTVQSWVRLKDVHIGNDVIIKNCSVIEDSRVDDGASVGPFGRIRMHAEIGDSVVIGNFVEVKKSKIGRRTKAQHLAYLGDATLGENVNIGAGTITCNFDGERKHETIVDDDVKIGSDTMLVAPVRVGKGSKTGAGSVIIKDIPPDSLAVGVPAVVKKKLR